MEQIIAAITTTLAHAPSASASSSPTRFFTGDNLVDLLKTTIGVVAALLVIGMMIWGFRKKKKDERKAEEIR